MRTLIVSLLLAAAALAADVAKYEIFEAEFRGPSTGNSYVEVEFTAEFTHGSRSATARGFYDEGGVYRIRFMPDAEGDWTYRTSSNRPELDGKQGSFRCTAALSGNRGPVRVRDTYHFAYDDGTPFFPFGTTIYAMIHQGEKQEQLTLDTLKTAGFNKVRLCLFPKDYQYNRNEPEFHPYQRQGDGTWIFDRFDPAYWRHLEQRLTQLADLGIEADLILWHPYDRWKHSHMTEAQDVLYLRYAIARLAAHRNVWWSLANEYDFMLKRKPMSRWDLFFKILQDEDPHHHLRSIHNGNINKLYDHTQQWVTHASLQHSDVMRVREWRAKFGKPIMNDECEYEGNIPEPWGNISARELVHRFWIMVAGGGYASHGETYVHGDDVLWWSKGGKLHGESAPRIAFLRKLVEERPSGFSPSPDNWIWTRLSGAEREGEQLIYLSTHQPVVWNRELPKEGRYHVDIIDPWEMTIDRLPGPMTAPFQIPLPGKPYLAIRLTPAD